MAEESKQAAELRLHLTVDDNSQETTKKLTENLGGIGDKLKEHKGRVDEIASGVFKGNLYWEATKTIVQGVEDALSSAYEIAEKFGEEAVHAADAAQVQERAMSGLMHLMDGGKNSMQALGMYSEDIREHLEEAGQQAGVSTKQMVEMFSTITERGNLSTEAAKELTEKMADVGKLTRGGMSGLAEGFAMMELGIVRARNPLVQLISTMGLLHGNARQVAMAMQKMTPDKQMKLAQEAIEKQSEQLKKGGGIELTLGEYKTSFESYREMFFEAMGKPLLGELLPLLARVQGWLGQNGETIKEYGRAIGEEMSKGVEILTTIGGGIYDAVKNNWGEIKQTLHDGSAELRAVWDYIYQNQKAIAATFHDVAKDLLDVASWLAAHSPGGGKQGPSVDDLRSAAKDPSKMALHPGETSAYGQIEEKVRQTSAVNDENVQKQLEGIDLIHKRTMEWAQQTEGYANQVEEASKRMGELAPGSSNEDLTSDMQTASDNFAAQVAQAGIRGDTAMMEWAADLVSHNENLAMSLIQSKDKLGPAFDEFAQMIIDKGGEVGELMKKMKGQPDNIKPGTGGVVQNFHGGIHIVQDFKDVEPDRIIVMFRRDLVKHSNARIDARTSMGFGGL